MKHILYSLFLIPLCGAVIQEITFHENAADGFNNSYIYRHSVPDTSKFPFGNIIRYCSSTSWLHYTEVNYEKFYGIQSDGCYQNSFKAMKSFRIPGNRDTMVDGVSLYSEPSYCGNETYVGRSPFAVRTPIKSLAYTGKSSWTVFENDNFDGKTACLPAGWGTMPEFYNSLEKFNMTTIGSMFKGCVKSVTLEISEAMRQQVRARGYIY